MNVIAKTAPATNRPIPSRINPTFGWKNSQHIETANKNNGRHRIKAAIKIAILAAFDKIPPISGI